MSQSSPTDAALVPRFAGIIMRLPVLDDPSHVDVALVGTPEIGGLTTREAQHALRSLYGCNIIGADVVEVSPPFEASGLTAFTGASLMFELLCIIAEGRGT